MDKPNFEDILNLYAKKLDEGSIVVVNEYGRQMWNAALEWAKENVKIKKTEELTSGTYDRGTSTSYSVYEDDGRYCTNFFIDKESILKGKL